MANELMFAEAEKAQAAVEAAQAKVDSIRARITELKVQGQGKQDQQMELIDMASQQREAETALLEAQRAASAAAVKHVWTKDDTYASLAQHFYGSFQEPYWRLIYEYNKAVIGNHPNDIKVGMEIKIPPLPKELRK